ncbi:MAG: hypothetical protein O2954_15510, partial [bacterium]|nr:hypothetical protein [bacterium]
MRIIVIVLGLLFAGEGVAGQVDSVRVDSLCQAGRNSLAGENLEEAQVLFKQALDASPESLEALRGLGEVVFRQEKWGDVKEVYGKVLAQVPEDAEALYRRAIGFRETGKVKATGPRWLDWRASEQLFKKLVEKWPVYGDGYLQYAELERYRGEYRKAIRLGEMQVEVRPGWGQGEFRLFRLYRHLLDNGNPVEEAGWLREQTSEFAQ